MVAKTALTEQGAAAATLLMHHCDAGRCVRTMEVGCDNHAQLLGLWKLGAYNQLALMAQFNRRLGVSARPCSRCRQEAVTSRSDVYLFSNAPPYHGGVQLFTWVGGEEWGLTEY